MSLSAVQVNDKKGEHLTKIVVGETVHVALQRLKHFGTGTLENAQGVALLDTELITAEDAPYVFFKKLQQQQQEPTVPEEYKPALLFAKQQYEAKTEHKAMSVASYEFARLLLSGMNINVEIDTPNNEAGSTTDPSPYNWTVETKDNEIIKKGEHPGTPGARDWFLESFVEENSEFCLKVVTGEFLPSMKANKRSTAGKGDLVIGKQHQLAISVSPYEQAYGLVELKTGEYPIKPSQNVLELASLATISRLGRSVALLATDCGAKWELCYFKDRGTIQRRAYAHGRKCWEDFKKLLDTGETRVFEPPASRYKPTLPNFEEIHDQNLDGFDYGDDDGGEDGGKMKAVERHAMLENLANQLAEIYGERPVVPDWARAEATCPDYYT